MESFAQDVRVPDEIIHVIDKAIAKGKKHKRKKRITGFTGIISITCLIMVVISGFVFPVLAGALSNLPVIGSIFESTGGPILQNVYRKGLVDDIYMQGACNGTTVTIREVYYDSSMLSVGYTIKGKKAGIEDDSRYYVNLFRDGKIIDGGIFDSQGVKLSENEYSHICGVIFGKDKPLPVEFDLEIRIFNGLENANNGNDPDISFAFKVSRKNNIDKSREYSIGKTFGNDRYKLKVNEIRFTPSVTFMDYEITCSQGKDMVVDLYDGDGNEKGAYFGTSYHEEDVPGSPGLVKTHYTTFYDAFGKIPEEIILSVHDLHGADHSEMHIDIPSGH